MPEPVRYPDPAVRVLDPRFESCRVPNAAVERIATGFRWVEGPVWFGDHRCLLWSDIPNDRVMRWDEQTGAVSVFRSPSSFSNGNYRDRQGRLVTCEHLTRRVTRTEHDGTIAVLADTVDGRRLNAPNDVVVSADGAVWFTDPGYGIMSGYEGERAELELPTRVYRIDPDTGVVETVIESLERPNGLCFSPQETLLYVVDSGSSPATIHVYDMSTGRPAGGRVFADMHPAPPTGSAATPRATCGPPRREAARATTGSTSSHPTAPGSGRSCCRSGAATSASVGAATAGCS